MTELLNYAVPRGPLPHREHVEPPDLHRSHTGDLGLRLGLDGLHLDRSLRVAGRLPESLGRLRIHRILIHLTVVDVDKELYPTTW